jgi:DNA-binding response OmpR family regulator
MKFCRLLGDYLQGFGYEVRAVHNGDDALSTASMGQWQAIILDIMMPGIDGFEVLRQLRARGINLPVLMLTALGDEMERIVGLELGADDYIAKTCSPREILARLRAVLRRAVRETEEVPVKSEPDQIVVGPLTVNLASRSAWLSEDHVPLTPVEFDLLVVLAHGRGRVKTREELINSIRDRNYDVLDRSIDVHVSSLRRKLGDDPRNPRFIKTVRSAGYMLINPRQQAQP